MAIYNLEHICHDFRERPPIRLEYKHWPEYEIQRAPWTNTSISQEVFDFIYSISLKDNSLDKTILLKPALSKTFAPDKLWQVIWVLACIGKSGKFFIRRVARPISCTIIPSMPNS